jgi:predicted HAD superfamily Cof-like phosphohydrolase
MSFSNPAMNVPVSPMPVDMIGDVHAFHLFYGSPVLPFPQVPNDEVFIRRHNFIDSEVNEELLPAMAAGDLPGIADGIADAIYVLIGTALEYGIPLESVWRKVQEANMAKHFNGVVKKNELGKVLKPDNWQAPNIAKVIADAIHIYKACHPDAR